MDFVWTCYELNMDFAPYILSIYIIYIIYIYSEYIYALICTIYHWVTVSELPKFELFWTLKVQNSPNLAIFVCEKSFRRSHRTARIGLTIKPILKTCSGTSNWPRKMISTHSNTLIGPSKKFWVREPFLGVKKNSHSRDWSHVILNMFQNHKSPYFFLIIVHANFWKLPVLYGKRLLLKITKKSELEVWSKRKKPHSDLNTYFWMFLHILRLI